MDGRRVDYEIENLNRPQNSGEKLVLSRAGLGKRTSSGWSIFTASPYKSQRKRLRREFGPGDSHKRRKQGYNENGVFWMGKNREKEKI